MSKFELRLPQMGESVAEATITSWLKEVGDEIELDDAVLEIATDKVDSDVPCDVSGVLTAQMFNVGDVVKVGQVLAIIDTDEDIESTTLEEKQIKPVEEVEQKVEEIEEEINQVIKEVSVAPTNSVTSSATNFYSPLVKKIAKTEGVTQEELDAINGTGLEGRVTKDDILVYVKRKQSGVTTLAPKLKAATTEKTINIKTAPKSINLEIKPEDEIIHLSRMGKLISDHMLNSKHKSAHVQSFIEVDVTHIVAWRKKVKDSFLKTHGEKLTFTPIFMMAIAKAIKKYPLVNITFDGEEQVVLKKAINLGMASALPDGNLIVPVIKDAQNLNLLGMSKAVNDLATRSKNNKLKPEDVKGGTYTVTNIGGFGSLFGTPIINQPECAILALGAIRKVPAVVETPEGDFIGIRQKMYISHSYDHRVINGALGGMFIKEVKDILEAWDVHASI